MGKQHVSGGKIAVKQQKTGTALKIKMHPDLVAIMAATPSDHLTFLVSAWGNVPIDVEVGGQALPAVSR
jgi:hypothetical protein